MTTTHAQPATRADVPERYTWDLAPVYADDAAWEADFARLADLAAALASFEGRLGESAETLEEALRAREALGRALERLQVYAGRRADEDTTIARNQAMVDRLASRAAEARAAGAFVRPELVALGPEAIARLVAQHPALAVYQHFFDDVARDRAHVLSPSEERLLAQAGELALAPEAIYSRLANADLDFGDIEDESGRAVALTLGSLDRFLRSPDRRVRRDAFHGVLAEFAAHRNTCAAAFNAHVRQAAFFARARRFPSARAAALHGGNIPEAVYDTLVASAREHLPLLHRSFELRRRVLGLDELQLWDLRVPLVAAGHREVGYDEGVATVLSAVAPLGERYVDAARGGLLEQRWVDVFETPNKRRGAYSGGLYDTPPYILLNYQPTLDGVSTLAHELGHSMHSWLTNAAQPWVYSVYSIFTAEVASITNEALLAHHLLTTTADPLLRAAILAERLNTLRGTFFRQAMFADFEHRAYALSESGEALTADRLSELHLALNREYHGPGVAVDEAIAVEWAFLPHFYYDFYVYQYATGLIAATALADAILVEGAPAAERFLRFLGQGGHGYPVDLLREAGVDMTTPEPTRRAMAMFERQLDELEALLA